MYKNTLQTRPRTRTQNNSDTGRETTHSLPLTRLLRLSAILSFHLTREKIIASSLHSWPCVQHRMPLRGTRQQENHLQRPITQRRIRCQQAFELFYAGISFYETRIGVSQVSEECVTNLAVSLSCAALWSLRCADAKPVVVPISSSR
eukprot:COSAG02_NODE_477_length_21523_cov_11.763163_18_plen_147_part_00